jgi:NADPH:quinone reductase-like Zn-dependent oxidoreductase
VLNLRRGRVNKKRDAGATIESPGHLDNQKLKCWAFNVSQGGIMRAIVYRDFGSPDVLKAEDVEKPTPADNEVLVAVRAASVNMFDWYMVRGKPALLRPALGLGRPKPLGVDLSGVVETSGRSVSQFKPGDQVFGTGRDKGLRSTRGAFAEYVSATERALAIMPFTRGKLVSFVARANPDDLNVLRELIESGAVTPVIDRSYSLEETSKAVEYVAAGHTRGKVVIAIGADTEKSA